MSKHDRMSKYEEGIAGIHYKIVPKSWRSLVQVRNYLNKKSPTNQMVLDLLHGLTIFAYAQDRKSVSFGSLYSVAANNGKVLRLYQLDDLDDNVYKGYLMWMEDR